MEKKTYFETMEMRMKPFPTIGNFVGIPTKTNDPLLSFKGRYNETISS
ncbi:hypothetical protein LEP1GSC060_2069 [Leptospira weilii serovar Ranarum str. ICFT]|uniref:Uncharacterized protein n=1 Tax=Leptospira weilii serovar Ranarum str. ICFT TaxID=1218598 RepID=N1WMX0_9LEPT|nr:hypothetical protein LEP1GSC060_2069 [Leptospira weilii serovar Ranarum str. ICFT]